LLAAKIERKFTFFQVSDCVTYIIDISTQLRIFFLKLDKTFSVDQVWFLVTTVVAIIHVAM